MKPKTSCLELKSELQTNDAFNNLKHLVYRNTKKEE
jgi:hypothetical protein